MQNLDKIPANLRLFVSAWAIGKSHIDVEHVFVADADNIRIGYRYKATGRFETVLVSYVTTGLNTISHKPINPNPNASTIERVRKALGLDENNEFQTEKIEERKKIKGE